MSSTRSRGDRGWCPRSRTQSATQQQASGSPHQGGHTPHATPNTKRRTRRELARAIPREHSKGLAVKQCQKSVSCYCRLSSVHSKSRLHPSRATLLIGLIPIEHWPERHPDAPGELVPHSIRTWGGEGRPCDHLLTQLSSAMPLQGYLAHKEQRPPGTLQ